MNKETGLQRRIMLANSSGERRLFRNNAGQAWQGDARRLPNGDVLIKNPRRVVYGLHPGSSDLIGWRSLVISPAMCGERVAVFAAIEVKTQRGRLTEQQRNFIDCVRQHGGIAGVAKSEEDARIIMWGR